MDQIRDQMIDFMADPDSVTFIAEEDRRVVGYADGLIRRRSTHLPRTVGHIGTIYVEESHRKRGVGTLLVETLCDHFRENEVDQVNLRYVIGNHEAERFWSGFGFKPVIITSLVNLQELEKRINAK